MARIPKVSLPHISEPKTVGFDFYERQRPRVLCTTEIKNQLREIVQDAERRPYSDWSVSTPNRDIPVVISQRATGKTYGLVHFVGERTLILPEGEEIAILTPNHNIADRFEDEFKRHFPTLKVPYITHSSRVPSAFCGRSFREVYIEEFFLIEKRVLHDLPSLNTKVVVGLGTIETPTTISIRV